LSQENQPDFCNLTFTSAILDSISANIAVVDSTGKILAVNRSWEDFAAINQMSDNARLGIGVNYFDVCRAAGADPNARAALKGILDVLQGRQSSFYHRYPCHSPDEQRWFALRATPLIDYPRYVVVAHENITEQVRAGIADRPSKEE